MDVQMPVMDGYAATRQIRTMPQLNKLPIIALTAGVFKSQHVAALEAGMDDFIVKPFEVDELVACVERLAHRRLDETASALLVPKAVLQIQPAVFEIIPLIDVENGLKKWRDVAFYHKHLQLFIEKHGQDAEHFRSELSNGNKTAAMIITHKLLGAAGALSLKRIVCFVEKIEATFDKQDNSEDTMMSFASILSQTLDAINVYLESEIQPLIRQTTVASVDNSIIRKELEQLIAVLDSDNPTIIEPQLRVLSEKLPKASFDKILTAIENFDFRGAEAIVRALVTDVFSTRKE
jgi:HPt (histidine-containing phosphotransfer) domain-containing protein